MPSPPRADLQLPRERSSFEREMSALQLYPEREHEAPRAAPKPATKAVAKAATIGFEFDLNYGIEFGVFNARKAVMPAGATFPAEHAPFTTHEKRDSGGKLADGFVVKRDGERRMEISTVPIAIDDEAEFNAIVANVDAFGLELETSARIKNKISVPGIRGNPILFEHPRTSIGRLPLVIVATGRGDALRFPGEQLLMASPQATITLPLGRVGDLIAAIERTKGGKPGVALTGGHGRRLGLRSDLAVLADASVVADRKRKIGTLLSDKSRVEEADFSPALSGLVTLLVMYLLTSVKVSPADARKEGYAKGSLPLNVKTPFWAIFKHVLTAREQKVFKELYGNAGVRAQIFKLAKPGAGASAGQNRLFPKHTHGDIDRFHFTPQTWNSLIEHVVSDMPLLVTKDNAVAKPNHMPGAEILFAPLSSKIDFATTDPRIAIELRRIGFDWVPREAWGGLMEKVRTLTKELNS